MQVWTKFVIRLDQAWTKFGPSLDQVENLHETVQIVSYRPENHRFRIKILRPETWDH